MEQYIGVDLHKAFLQVCAVDGLGQRCWEDRFDTTPEGLARFLARTPSDGHVAVEASGPTGPLWIASARRWPTCTSSMPARRA